MDEIEDIKPEITTMDEYEYCQGYLQPDEQLKVLKVEDIKPMITALDEFDAQQPSQSNEELTFANTPTVNTCDMDKGLRIKYDCPICRKQFASKCNFERHQVSHRNNICEFCNKSFASRSGMFYHQRNHCKGSLQPDEHLEVPKVEDIKPGIPPLDEFDVQQPSQSNEELTLANTPTVNTGDIDKGLRIKYYCPICRKQFASKCKVERHQVTHRINICEFCNKRFASRSGMLYHQRNHCKEAKKNNSSCYKIEYCQGSIQPDEQLEVPRVEDIKPTITALDEFNVQQPSQSNEELTSADTPTVITCQNCKANFPSKYKFQRHKCEFNIENFVLKPNANTCDIDKGLRIKYVCSTCGKQFVSKRNIERHQVTHRSNICEFCNKQFASRTVMCYHKQNHCKEARKNDSSCWKCLNCSEVFATLRLANMHVENCKKIFINVRIDERTSQIFLESNVVDDTEISINDRVDASNKNVQEIKMRGLLQCEYCNRTYVDKEILLMHQKKHTTKANYECTMCKETFDSYVNATNHWLTKCTSEANLFSIPKLICCAVCGQTYKSHKFLYVHKFKNKHLTLKPFVTNIKREMSEENEETVDEKKPNLKLDDIVLSGIKSPLNEENEDEESADKENNAPDNSRRNDPQEHTVHAETSKSLKKSIENKEMPMVVGTSYMYQCEKCPMVWANIADLENHRQSEHYGKLKCDECDKEYQNTRDLLVHTRSHLPFKCEVCPRTYSQRSHLTVHMKFHQGIKLFTCSHKGCDVRYIEQRDLRDHIRRVHTRKRPFKCTDCNKCFLTNAAYYQHRMIHMNDRRYQCEICEKKFCRKATLKNHIRIHTDERPYACHLCDRQFRQKWDRYMHIRKQHSA